MGEIIGILESLGIKPWENGYHSIQNSKNYIMMWGDYFDGPMTRTNLVIEHCIEYQIFDNGFIRCLVAIVTKEQKESIGNVWMR